MVSAGFRWSPARVALAGTVLAYLGCLLLVPLIVVVAQALGEGFPRVLAGMLGPEALEGLLQSLALAAIALGVNAVFGVLAALVLTRQRFAGRGVLDAAVDLPLGVSPVVTGLAFLLLFGRGGWLEPALSAAAVRVVFSFPGLVLATLFVTLPFTVREVAHVLEELGSSEEESAATLGASAWQTFWRVTLPNVRGALGFGSTLTAARALGEFGAVLVLGGAISGRTQTATTFIYSVLEERREPEAYGMALILAAAGMGVLVVMERWRTAARR